MTEWIDSRPHVQVQPAEYLRLLGYPARPRARRPRARPRRGRACLVRGARASLDVRARSAGRARMAPRPCAWKASAFTARALGERFTQSEAGGAVLAALSAGPELEAEAQRRWRDERPDEYYFLEVLGSAVVERLAVMAGARLCAWADARSLAVLPHYSPGYPEWDIGRAGPPARAAQAIRRAARRNRGARERRAAAQEIAAGRLRTARPPSAGILPPRPRPCPATTAVLRGCQFRRAATTRVNPKALAQLGAASGSRCDATPDGGIEARFHYRRHHLHQHGPPAALSIPRETGAARGRLSDRRAGVRARVQRHRPSSHVRFHGRRRRAARGDRRGPAAARPAPRTMCCMAASIRAARAAIASPPAGRTSGAWRWRPFITRWPNGKTENS